MLYPHRLRHLVVLNSDNNVEGLITRTRLAPHFVEHIHDEFETQITNFKSQGLQFQGMQNGRDYQNNGEASKVSLLTNKSSANRKSYPAAAFRNLFPKKGKSRRSIKKLKSSPSRQGTGIN